MTGLIARTRDQAQTRATYLRQAGPEVLNDEVTWQARTGSSRDTRAHAAPDPAIAYP